MPKLPGVNHLDAVRALCETLAWRTISSAGFYDRGFACLAIKRSGPKRCTRGLTPPLACNL
jgi:hypothetical protein